MSDKLRIGLAQMNPLVGDVAGNTALILGAIERARAAGAKLLLLPELAVCGYPPEDLLFHAGLPVLVEESLQEIRTASQDLAVVVGYPEYAHDRIFNSAAVFRDAGLIGNYRKHCLPNYSVFDEERYFSAGDEALVLDIDGWRVGLTICEDIWEVDPAAKARAAGAEMIAAINGSPFRRAKQELREQILVERVIETGLPMVYQNLVGGQDELVFDGGCCVVGADRDTHFRAPAFAEGLYCVDFARGSDGRAIPEAGELAPILSREESVYTALVTGVRDYVTKNGFPGVVLGLSGGIDSALTLAIAVDALGAERVHAVMMPYRWTSDMSRADAAEQAQRLGVKYSILPIEPIVSATTGVLAEQFAGLPVDTTEENIQARSRGMLLMAISNKTGCMVLATGNKSEMAVGYATLYGDMAGGFAPIKDCHKTLVYRLARYRNRAGEVIPERVINRPPSAELAPDQKDSDSLPPYDVLDEILEALMLDNLSVDEIVAKGIREETVVDVVERVRHNEYKRRQAPPGVRISGRAFGRDWRYPITSGYRHVKRK
ncbi:MAG: NAD+ synthase [Gammaproteobacteria bacterium]|nr:NAD+ synthase [Gammaproteobacteria bacterium]